MGGTSAHPDSGTIETVLVVDDNDKNRKVAEALLTMAGYAVRLADSGESAIATFTERPPDLVLLDILMPGMDGFETLARLRQLPAGDDTPIVFLTAVGDGMVHDRALASGADDFLTKPINRTELVLRVRSLLRIRRLTRELLSGYDLIRAQRDALLLAQAQKEELTQLVVHDLKNPIAGIRLHAQLLGRRPDLADDARRSVSFIVGASESMQRMVMNLLDISRSEDGALVAMPQAFSMHEIVDQTRELFARVADEKRQTLIVGSPPGACRLVADRELVRRIVENLVDNALKYSPGGAHVSLEVTGGDEAAVEIRVRDEGPGIPAVDRERVFEKYVRLDRDAESSARTSRGLGLVFCRSAARAHGGDVWIEPNEPKGAVFCVRIPQGEAIAETLTSPPTPERATPAAR